jgi:DNA transposition AAA+ family ATPase
MLRLNNVYAFMELAVMVRERAATLPNLGVFYGFSGYGKTYAAAYVRNAMRAVYVEVGSSWNTKTLLQKILFELGVSQPKGTISDLVDQAIMLLGENGDRPLIVDEADKLCDKGTIEIIREIADKTQVPVLLVGEEALPLKLRRVERVHNRVLAFVAAQPCDEDDVRALAEMVLDDVPVETELLLHIRKVTDGRARRIVTNLAKAREWYAKEQPKGGLTLANYGNHVESGDPPAPRNGRL